MLRSQKLHITNKHINRSNVEFQHNCDSIIKKSVDYDFNIVVNSV